MALVVVEEGPNRGAWFQLPEGESIIGRQAGVRVPLLDQSSSRKHAIVRSQGELLTLEDAGSRHGTFLNGLPVDEPAPLRAGDQIRLGDTVLRFEDEVGALAFDDVPPTVSLLGPIASPASPPGAAEAVLAVIAEAPGPSPGTPLAGLADLLGRALVAAGGRAARVEASGEGGGGRAVVEAGESAASLTAVDSDAELSLPLRDGGREVGTLRVCGEGAHEPAWRAVAAVLAPRVGGLLQASRRVAVEARERDRVAASSSLIAESAVMRRVLGQVLKVARGDANVLVTGESGTGKEVVARAIHENGPRARAAFVAVNAGSLPGTLLESELFGHERGAFTGAVARRKGLFELAHRGTLFLDEVGEMAPAAQANLLRVLESGEVRRVGGADVVKVDVRIVAATHRDLKDMVREGGFRQDLFYRFAVVHLELPPLRERPGDVEPLTRAILRELCGDRPPALAEGVLDRLRGYAFPGNVRELRNVLERALILGDGAEIGLCDLTPEVLVAGADGKPGETDGFPSLSMIERRHVLAALHRTKWVKKHAAELLGIDRKTLAKKIKDFGLSPEPV